MGARRFSAVVTNGKCTTTCGECNRQSTAASCTESGRDGSAGVRQSACRPQAAGQRRRACRLCGCSVLRYSRSSLRPSCSTGRAAASCALSAATCGRQPRCKARNSQPHICYDALHQWGPGGARRCQLRLSMLFLDSKGLFKRLARTSDSSASMYATAGTRSRPRSLCHRITSPSTRF